MKTLNEHNSQRLRSHMSMNSNEPRPNGIACPECGKELIDSNPCVTLTSCPPQKNVKCSECDYIGYRVA